MTKKYLLTAIFTIATGSSLQLTSAPITMAKYIEAIENFDTRGLQQLLKEPLPAKMEQEYLLTFAQSLVEHCRKEQDSWTLASKDALFTLLGYATIAGGAFITLLGVDRLAKEYEAGIGQKISDQNVITEALKMTQLEEVLLLRRAVQKVQDHYYPRGIAFITTPLHTPVAYARYIETLHNKFLDQLIKLSPSQRVSHLETYAGLITMLIGYFITRGSTKDARIDHYELAQEMHTMLLQKFGQQSAQ
jgi:hypothetical protein